MNIPRTNRGILCEIAKTAFQSLNRQLERDQRLSNQLRSSITGSRQIYREECLTTEMAVSLIEAFPDNVRMTLFTAPEETRIGADWYWRFDVNERSIHGLVQAKRLQRTEFGQADSEGRLVIDREQLMALTSTAESISHEIPHLNAWLATFVRFDAQPPCGNDDLQNCEDHRHPEECIRQEPSLWISDASSILEELKNVDNPVRNIIENSIRLDCLLPCSNSGFGSNRKIKGLEPQMVIKSFDECISIITNYKSISKNTGFNLRGALHIKLNNNNRINIYRKC